MAILSTAEATYLTFIASVKFINDSGGKAQTASFAFCGWRGVSCNICWFRYSQEILKWNLHKYKVYIWSWPTIQLNGFKKLDQQFSATVSVAHRYAMSHAYTTGFGGGMSFISKPREDMSPSPYNYNSIYVLLFILPADSIVCLSFIKKNTDGVPW